MFGVRMKVKKNDVELEKLYATHAIKNLASYKNDIHQEMNNEVKLNLSDDNIKLTLFVDKKNHLITFCFFEGDLTNVQKGIASELCSMLIDMPILEAAEHVTLRLEKKLRDKFIPNPVKGIILPENTYSFFLTIQQLLRKGLQQYRHMTNYINETNTFCPNMPESWGKLSNDQKLEKLNKIKDDFCNANSYDTSAIKLDTLSDYSRTIVDINPAAIDKKNHGSLLMALESLINSRLETHIELIYTEKKDSNIKRQNT